MASGAFSRDSPATLTFSLGGVRICLIFDGGYGLVVKEHLDEYSDEHGYDGEHKKCFRAFLGDITAEEI